MRILQLHKYYYPKVGGIESHVRQVAEGLGRHDDLVKVVASTQRKFGGRYEMNGVNVIKATGLAEFFSVPISPTFPFWTQYCASDADVIHVHLPDPLSVVSYLVTDPNPRTLVATYHSDIVKQETAFKYYEPLLTRFLDRVDRVITTSPRLLESSSVLSDFSDKTSIVPLSIDIDEVRSYEDPNVNIPGDDEKPTILFVGRLVYYKGLEYLIKSMDSVDADLLVIGGGKEEDRLRSMASSRGVQNQIHFMGKVDDDLLCYLYDLADLFVLPSCEKSEAFGIVQLEAMAHGTPVINTDLPTGVPWVSQDGETGLTVPHSDSRALAEAINELLSDESRLNAFGQQAKRRVEKKFTAEEMVTNLREVYLSAM